MVSTSEPSFTASCIRALLRCVDYGNFDQITKTKTIQSFFNSADDRVLKFLSEILKSIAAEDVSDEDDKQIIKRQKTIIDLQFQVVASVLHNAQQKDRSEHPRDLQIARDIMEVWLLESSSMPRPKFYVPELLDTSREHVKERLALAFEHALKLKAVGLMILMDTVLRLKPTDTNQQSLSSKFEESVYTLVQQAWKRLSDLSDRSERQPHSSSTDKSYPGFSDGLCLLYCLILFQIYNGETDAVGILQDVLEYQDRWKPLKTKESRSQAVQDPADAMVEIILSFASRPSKFLRTVTLQIFEAFAPFVTRHGLESLCRILVAKENAQGQQEMFQEENSEMEEGEGSHVGSHHSLDSDVEVEYLSNAEEFTSGDHESTSSSERSAQHPAQDSDKSDDEEDEELAAFDAALASALGTRRLDRADASDSGSSSDADMDDDEMMELDVKLAEVFRARNEQQSRNKKKEAKEAKENVVNFKNRVLDLIELYLRQQQQNPLTLYLIVPLLTLARTSRSKQLADRGCSIWQHFYTRSNKASNVPFLDSGRSVDDAFRVLRSVHNEACMDSSNAHSKVASQASIFLVKVLVNAVPEKIGIVVEIYAATQLRQLTEKKCRVSPTFFADWNNWCQTACEKLAT
ncbi:DNA-directed DNA polymerase [Rhinocladiella similis]